MCGNVGFIDRETSVFESRGLMSYFKQALIVDSIRGMDSTGVLALTNNNKLLCYKKATYSSEYITLKKAKILLDSTSQQFMLGHNRAATKGSIDDSSAHPFTFGDITMFHNGTLYTWDKLSGDKQFEVDSQAIAYGLHKFGIKNTLEKIDGAYALVWHDKGNNTVNFARNDERPLFIGRVAKSGSILYASEKGMISWLAEKNNIKLESVKELPVGEHLSIPVDAEESETKTSFKPMEIYAWQDWSSYSPYSYKRYTPTKNKFQEANKDLVGLRVEVLFDAFKPYSMAADVSKRLGYLSGGVILGEGDANRFFRVTVDSLLEKKCNTLLTEHKPITVSIDSIASTYIRASIAKHGEGLHYIPPEDSDIIEENKDVLIYNPVQRWITEREFEKMTSTGCGNCSRDLDVEEASSLTWVNGESPVCEDCKDTLDIVETFNSCEV